MTLLTLSPVTLQGDIPAPVDLTTTLSGSPLGSNTGVLFANSLRVVLAVSVTASTTVTSDIGTTVQGQTVPGIQETLGSAGTWLIGPFPSQFDKQDGTSDVEVDFGTPASVSGVALLYIPGVS